MCGLPLQIAMVTWEKFGTIEKTLYDHSKSMGQHLWYADYGYLNPSN